MAFSFHSLKHIILVTVRVLFATYFYMLKILLQSLIQKRIPKSSPKSTVFVVNE